MLPLDPDGRNAGVIRAGYDASKRFGEYLMGVCEKGRLEEADLAVLKGLCSAHAYEKVLKGMEREKESNPKQDPNRFKTFWNCFAIPYKVGVEKVLAIPAGDFVFLLAMDKNERIRQFIVKKDKDNYVVAGAGHESLEMAPFLMISGVERKIVDCIKKHGFTIGP